jgi:hypothetical protein
MMELLSHYLPSDEVERLLRLPPGAIYKDPNYLNLLKQVRYQLLSDATSQSYALCDWIISFLEQSDLPHKLVNWHNSTSSRVMVDALPDLLTILETIPNSRQDWQRALVLLTLPLLSGKRPPFYS